MILGPGFVFLSWSCFMELLGRLLICHKKALEGIGENSGYATRLFVLG